MDCKNTFSPESHERFLRIEWNMFLHDPTWKYHHMKPCSFFQFLVEFSPLHMILVVQLVCQVCEFKHLLNSDSHEKMKSSRKILKIHNQDFRNFSSLLIFKLSSCDSSNSLITYNGESSKVYKMSSIALNSILSDFQSSMSQREHMIKKPFWYFWFDQLWPFNFHFGCRPKCSNHNILVSSHSIWKLRIVLEIARLREYMVRYWLWDFKCFTSRNTCNFSTSPRANFWPVTSKIFSRHRF